MGGGMGGGRYLPPDYGADYYDEYGPVRAHAHAHGGGRGALAAEYGEYGVGGVRFRCVTTSPLRCDSCLPARLPACLRDPLLTLTLTHFSRPALPSLSCAVFVLSPALVCLAV